MRHAFYAALFVALAASMMGVGGQARAQETASDQSGNVVSLGSNAGNFVESGRIGTIILSEAGAAQNDAQVGALTDLSALLTDLTERGEVALSETAIRELARSAVATLAQQELTRDVISTRQFEIPYQQTYNIAGTRNRITFNRSNCGGGIGITITFNRDPVCMRPGGTHTFSDDGVEYDLVFDGYPGEGRDLAQFTIYPTQ